MNRHYLTRRFWRTHLTLPSAHHLENGRKKRKIITHTHWLAHLQGTFAPKTLLARQQVPCSSVNNRHIEMEKQSKNLNSFLSLTWKNYSCK